MLNTLNSVTLADIGMAIDAISGNDDIRVVVITSEGDKAFATSADIRQLEELPNASAALSLAKKAHEVFSR